MEDEVFLSFLTKIGLAAPADENVSQIIEYFSCCTYKVIQPNFNGSNTFGTMKICSRGRGWGWG